MFTLNFNSWITIILQWSLSSQLNSTFFALNQTLEVWPCYIFLYRFETELSCSIFFYFYFLIVLQTLYDMLMDMLHDRGINDEFIQSLTDYSTAYEQECKLILIQFEFIKCCLVL